MSWRNILVENPCRVFIKNTQLTLQKEQGEMSIAVEDIATLLIDHPQVLISSEVFHQLGKAGAVIIFTNNSHLPQAICLPYQNYYKQLATQKMQLSTSQRLKNRLWQDIVKVKITNQALCLEYLGQKEQSEKLYYLAQEVKSADIENIESQAAKYYFVSLMGQGFNRRLMTLENTALNYGYAIIRSSIAKEIACYGLIPSIGLFHKNELNAFNLVDDLIEPYRALIDLLVHQKIISLETKPNEKVEFTTKHKLILLEVLGLEIEIEGRVHSVLNSIKLYVESLLKALHLNDTQALQLPKLLNINSKEYE